MIIATFGPSTGWSGKPITFDGREFVLDGHGPIAATAVVEYVAKGQAAWASSDTKQLALTMVAQRASVQPQRPADGWGNVRGWLGSPRQLVILAALVFVMFVLWAFVSQMN